MQPTSYFTRPLLVAIMALALALPAGSAAAEPTGETTAKPVTTMVKKTTKKAKKASKKSGKKLRKKKVAKKKAVKKKAARQSTRKAAGKSPAKAVRPVASPVPAAAAIPPPAVAVAVQTVAPSSAAAGEYVSVSADGVFVRATPSAKGEKRSELFSGFPLKVVQRQDQWLRVIDFEGDEGWIQATQLSGEKAVIANRKKINLREDPNSDKNNPIVAIVKYGVVFTPLEQKGEWLKVRHAEGVEGWVQKDLVWPANPLD